MNNGWIRFRISTEKPERLTDVHERGRANVRAMRIAEIDEQPLPTKVAIRNPLAVGAG